MADYAGSISLSQARDLSHTSDDEEDDRRTAHTAPPLSQPSKLRITTITPARAAASGGSDATTARKPRGRPPGSKNRPKPPVVLTRESESGMKSAVLEISAGSDIVDTVVQFGRRHQLGVSIISGSGSVSNVTLRHPASHAPAMTLHGPFNILSLTGTFVAPSSSSSSYYPAAAACSFGISLAGQQGQVFGGIVGGKVTAATPVVLVVATFLNPSFHRLPGEFEEAAGEESPAKCRVGGGGASEGGCSTTAMSVYVGASPSPLNSQAPPGDVLPWTSTCRPPHQPNY